MKAYVVNYSTGGNDSRVIVLTDHEDNIEKALANKKRDYRIGSKWCRITHKEEIPMSNVTLSDLSIEEFKNYIQS